MYAQPLCDAHRRLLYFLVRSARAKGQQSFHRLKIAMRTTYLSTYLSLCLFFSWAFSIPVAQIEDPQLSDVERPDFTFSGSYKIANCGAYQPARLKPEALQVKNFLLQAGQPLELLLADVRLGTASKYGYAALLKTNESLATIEETFQYVAIGAPIPPTDYNPTLVCLHADETVPLWQHLYDQGCAGGTRAVVSFPKLAHVGLCPGFFFAGRRGFPIPGDCPVLTANNTMADPRYSMVSNRYAYYLEEMLHLYRRGSSAEEERLEGGYAVQEAIDLSATASLADVRNWVTYAMGEWLSEEAFGSPEVQANCKISCPGIVRVVAITRIVEPQYPRN